MGHEAATKFKFLYKINQRNNQSKNLTYGWPWLMKKNQEETKIFPNWSKLVQIGLNLPKLVYYCPNWSKLVHIGLNLFHDLIHWPATTIKTIKTDVGVALPTRPHKFS